MEDLVEVALLGGPASIPRTFRAERSKIHEGKLKIEHHGGYEHFEYIEGPRETGNADNNSRPMFRWAFRTKPAE